MPKLAGLLWIAACAAASAQPTIHSVQNAANVASRGPAGAGIAPGSIFAVAGEALAPEEDLEVPPVITIDVTSADGAAHVALTPLTTSPTRLTAVLPGDFPPGDATFTVTLADQTSEPHSTTIPERSFGFFTLDGTGRGSAVVHDPEGNPYTLIHAANPGETIVLEATGFGPIAEDQTIELIIGGVPTEAHVHAPTEEHPGRVRIEAVVPEHAEGCHTSVYTVLDGVISNTPTVPIAPAEQRLCRDLGYIPQNLEDLYTRDNVTAGWMALGKFITYLPPLPDTPEMHVQDSANAGYIQSTILRYSNFGGWGESGFNSCVVWSYRGEAGTPPPAEVRFLDAGETLTLRTPDGTSVDLAKSDPFPTYVYAAAPPQRPLFIDDAGGAFTFHAPGGEDVGEHEASIDAMPRLEWTNRPAPGDIARDTDLHVDWTPGLPGDYVVISGVSSDGAPTPDNVGTEFSCTARAEDGHFTVPAAILSSLVPSFEYPPPIAFPTGQLSFRQYRKPQTFEAPGLDVGSINSYIWHLVPVRYH